MPESVYENSRVYVCTREVYRGQSIPVGVTKNLDNARTLLGLPDPDDWQTGTPIDMPGPYASSPATVRRVWYSMKAGEPLPQIVETPVFGSFDGST